MQVEVGTIWVCSTKQEWKPVVEIVEVTKPNPKNKIIWVRYKYLNCLIPGEVFQSELQTFQRQHTVYDGPVRTLQEHVDAS